VYVKSICPIWRCVLASTFLDNGEKVKSYGWESRSFVYLFRLLNSIFPTYRFQTLDTFPDVSRRSEMLCEAQKSYVSPFLCLCGSIHEVTLVGKLFNFMDVDFVDKNKNISTDWTSGQELTLELCLKDFSFSLQFLIASEFAKRVGSIDKVKDQPKESLLS
jgi:hypothetical protein